MEPLRTIIAAHQKILADVQRFLATVNHLSSQPCETAEAGIGILYRLKKETYEDLNQIQHEHLIVRAAEWLLARPNYPRETMWYWNPRQTGDHTEPDLRGIHSGVTLVSAEITTSEKPDGAIDKRMKKTLTKLAVMEGEKFYFVRTLEMYKRATTKITKARWEIEVIRLAM